MHVEGVERRKEGMWRVHKEGDIERYVDGGRMTGWERKREGR